MSVELARLNCPLSTIPGFGPVFTAGILAEIGNIQRLPGRRCPGRPRH
ncbi:MAG: transposase [Moorella sp. (in: Bacteria)]|nr:transposase [Moorella sp. (in: firmicutes)]